MPRGPKVPPATRRDWLEAHERGQRIDAIAREAGRTERTVKEHIELARQEREQGEVRSGLLRDAYQRHYEDLLAFAQHLRQVANTPTPGGLRADSDRRSLMLWDALRSHIPNSGLWKACREWEDWAQRLANTRSAITVQIATAVASCVRGYFPEARQDWLVNSLSYAANSVIPGETGPLKGMEYDIEPGPEGQRVRWGNYVLAELKEADQARAAELVEKHKQLVSQVIAWEPTTKLPQVHHNWTQARDAIDEQVEVLLLRRLLPGRCQLCPGSVSGRARKSRRRREP